MTRDCCATVPPIMTRQLFADWMICKFCLNCCMLVKAGGNRYDIECKASPNLGAVSVQYGKCPSYKAK